MERHAQCVAFGRLPSDKRTRASNIKKLHAVVGVANAALAYISRIVAGAAQVYERKLKDEQVQHLLMLRSL